MTLSWADGTQRCWFFSLFFYGPRFGSVWRREQQVIIQNAASRNWRERQSVCRAKMHRLGGVRIPFEAVNPAIAAPRLAYADEIRARAAPPSGRSQVEVRFFWTFFINGEIAKLGLKRTGWVA